MNTKEFLKVYIDCSNFDFDAMDIILEKAEQTQKMGVFLVSMERHSGVQQMARALSNCNFPFFIIDDLNKSEGALHELKKLDCVMRPLDTVKTDQEINISLSANPNTRNQKGLMTHRRKHYNRSI